MFELLSRINRLKLLLTDIASFSNRLPMVLQTRINEITMEVDDETGTNN